MNLDELQKEFEDGAVDTVLLAHRRHGGAPAGQAPDRARTSSTRCVEHGAEGCNYLLAVDVDMDTVAGYEMSSWERGYGDFVMKPDFDTLRPIPWHEGTVLLMADLHWEDGSDVVASPRQILRRQLARLAERGWNANAGTELEFIVFRDTYEDAWHKGYRDLEPANLYNVDYSMLGTARVEPLIRRIRNAMMGAGMTVENSKGECNFGQHEINFHYGEALRDRRRPRDLQERRQGDRRPGGRCRSPSWRSSTRREGNSCHIHCSLADEDGENAFADDRQTVRPLPRRPARLPARADAVLRPARQLLQALRAGLVRADRGRLGQRQPHLLDARRRPRPGAARREPAARRRRQPVPGAGGDDRRGPARRSTTSSRSSRRSRATPTPSDKPHVPTQPLRGARPVRRAARSPARRSARRSSTTT